MRAIVLLVAGLASMMPTAGAAGAARRAPRHAAPRTCGGIERWSVKVGSDIGASLIHPVPVDGITIVDLNRLLPQPLDPDGRMLEEKVIYRLTGVLRLFKHDADGDYHLVIADDPTTLIPSLATETGERCTARPPAIRSWSRSPIPNASPVVPEAGARPVSLRSFANRARTSSLPPAACPPTATSGGGTSRSPSPACSSSTSCTDRPVMRCRMRAATPTGARRWSSFTRCSATT